MRVKSIRLSTPGGRRSLGPTSTSTSRQSLSISARPKATVFQIPSEITAEVERQLDQQDQKPTFRTKVARATRVGKTNSTISAGKLGIPGKIDISAYIRDDEKKEVFVKKEEEESDLGSSIAPHAQDERPKPGSSSSSSLPLNIKSDPSSTGDPKVTQPPFPPAFDITPAPPSSSGSPSPAPAPAPPPAGFGGLKFSLDPGDLSSAHTRNRTATSGPGSRAHHAAPRLSASPATTPSASSAPAISFFAPPQQSKSDTPSNPTNASGGGKAGPKGFVSFSGFGQK